VVLVAAAGLLAACTSTGAVGDGTAATGTGGPGGTSTAAPTATGKPAVTMTPSVAQGSTVSVDTVVSVAASGGTLDSVALTYQDAKAGQVTVEGTLAPDGTAWTAGSLLEPGMSYHLSMAGRNVDGDQSRSESAFTTQNLSKKQQIFPTIVGDGTTVGVAMPVVVHFDVPVTDKAAFEKRMTVTSVPAQLGAWAWYGNSEAHWRPKDYWKPGTKVTVNVDINGVAAGNGTYGQVSKTASFTVGSALVMQANLATDQLTVTQDGKVTRTIPITGGKSGWASRSGTKVIVEKFSKLKMDATTIGVEPGDPNYYSIPDVQYAMRETFSGEFLHAAPWSVGSQGRANVSHGCIGMSTSNAAWLFNQVKIGDPVVVTGTGRSLERGNGWTDWNVSFDEFKKYSALNITPATPAATSTATSTAKATSTPSASAKPTA
jgi:lipoprotein-anchoring transpeptidase ErfK/SrfK